MASPSDRLPFDPDLVSAVQQLTKTCSIDEVKQVIRANPQLVLSPETGSILDEMIRRRPVGDEDIPRLSELRDLLIRCHHEGTDAVFRSLKTSTSQKKTGGSHPEALSPEQLMGAIRQSQSTRDQIAQIWSTVHAAQREGQRAAEVFAQAQSLAQSPEFQAMWKAYKERGELPAAPAYPPGDVRDVGDHPITEPMPPAVQPLIRQIGQLNAPADALRRAELCRAALALIDRASHPQWWIEVSNQLANTLVDTQMGSPSDNIEEAIAIWQGIFDAFPRDQDPFVWAKMHMNLASAMTRRTLGEHARNLEEAIADLEAASQVCTREAHPTEWADIQHNLAAVYFSRIAGSRAENLERAIDLSHQALEIRTRETTPDGWAMTESNLSGIYLFRIRGERVENLQQTIMHGESALQVLTHSRYPFDWARTQNILAVAYFRRLSGKRIDNMEQSIHHCEEALTVFNPDQFPRDWAGAQFNLGNAYMRRRKGNRAENLELAIRCYLAALRIFTEGSFPEMWAEVHNSLAEAYFHRLEGVDAENIEEAIAHDHRALKVRTRQSFPEQWAYSQFNLGNHLSARIYGDPSDNLRDAIAAYTQALEVLTLETYPADHERVLQNMGDVYFERRGHWAEALQAYDAALEAGDVLLAEAYTEEGRQVEVGQISRAYARAAACLIELGRPAEAFQRADQGKTRLLVEALALGDSNLATLPENWQAPLLEARRALRQLEGEMRLPRATEGRREDRVLAEEIRQARAVLNGYIEQIRRERPEFLPRNPELSHLLPLVSPGEVLVAPVITSHGTVLFAIPGGVETIVEDHLIRIENVSIRDIDRLIGGVPGQPGWLGAYTAFRSNQDLAAWKQAIDLVGQSLWQTLMSSLHQRLVELRAKRVLFMLSSGLQLLPLHAAWRSVDGERRYFLDDFETATIPSGAALIGCARQAAGQGSGDATIIGVDRYTTLPPLRYACDEAAAIAQFFNTTPVLNEAAPLETVREAAPHSAYLHFSCHGGYAWGGSPLESALVLGGDARLTLAHILSDLLSLRRARLVTLSACETGIIDVNQSPDEYVGLPAGFLQAGAPAVVSSLWAVNDLSTRKLMECFYQNWRDGMSLAAALHAAQKWLRDGGAGTEYVHPFYWAPFVLTGL